MFRFGDPGGRAYTSSSDIVPWWTSFYDASGYAPVVSSGSGRLAGSALYLQTYGNGAGGVCQVTKILPDNQSTLGLAFAVKPTDIPGSGTVQLAAFLDGATQQCDLRVGALGQLIATRNGTVLYTSGYGVLIQNIWTHIEFTVTFSASSGVVYLAANGTQLASLTGQNTKNSANAYASIVTVGPYNVSGTTNNVSCYVDDIIVYDGQATDANGFTDITGPIGNCSLSWLLPASAGTTTQFTPLSGSNWSEVDDVTPDGDASYVSSQTVGNIDTYNMTQLNSSISAVKSVMAVEYSRIDGTTARGVKSELRSGGGNTSHATEILPSSSYTYGFFNWGQNPNNGTAINWTPATVNSLEAGQKVSS